MKKQLIPPIYRLLCLLIVMQGCSAGSDAPAGIYDVPHALAIQVSGTLFVAEDGTTPHYPATRTTDSGYGTTFATGDAIGVFVLKSDGNTLVVDNQQVTLQPNGSWQPVIKYTNAATCYAYYPYRSDMSGKKSVADIVSALGSPDTNQGTAALYAAQDALTALGTVTLNAQTVSFTFQHAQALIEINLPAGSTDVSFGNITPLAFGSNIYRYLATPGSNISLSATYKVSGNTYLVSATVAAPEAGKSKKVNIKKP